MTIGKRATAEHLLSFWSWHLQVGEGKRTSPHPEDPQWPVREETSLSQQPPPILLDYDSHELWLSSQMTGAVVQPYLEVQERALCAVGPWVRKCPSPRPASFGLEAKRWICPQTLGARRPRLGCGFVACHRPFWLLDFDLFFICCMCLAVFNLPLLISRQGVGLK